MLHKALQNKWARVLIAVFATFLYALGVNLFVVPMGLYSGGVVGLSQIIRTLLAQAVELPAGVDIAGILYFLINIPVLYLAWRDLGRAFLIRTLICVGASSLFLSVIQSPAVPILDDPLASCLVGGILCGFALGLALTCGCSTGGLDVVGLCLTKRGSRFTVGRFSLGFNIVLYIACASTSRRPSTPSSTPCSARFSSTADTSRTSMCRCSSSQGTQTPSSRAASCRALAAA